MKTIGKVTRKGRITIPIEMRRALGLQEGDVVTCTLRGDKIQIVRGRKEVKP